MRSEDEGWGIIAASIFFFWLDNYAFRRFLAVAMGAVMSATAVLPLRADKRNGRRDCDDEYGWGMRDGK